MKVKHLLIIVLVVLIGMGAGLYYHFTQKKEDTMKFASTVVKEAYDTISYGPPKDSFSVPVGIAINSKSHIFVTDSNNHRIREFNSDWRLIKNIGKFGKNKGQLGYPVGIAINSKGEIFVSEVHNKRIQVFSPEGEHVRYFPKNSADLKVPTALAIDKNNRIIVFDRGDQFVKVFNEKGELQFKFGGRGIEPGKLRFAMGIGVAPNGEIFISDSGNQRVQIFDKKGNLKNELTSGTKGLPDFAAPRGLVVINNEKFILVDSFGRKIYELTKTNDRWNTKTLSENFVMPDGITYSNGYIYVTDRANNSIVQIAL